MVQPAFCAYHKLAVARSDGAWAQIAIYSVQDSVSSVSLAASVGACCLQHNQRKCTLNMARKHGCSTVQRAAAAKQS